MNFDQFAASFQNPEVKMPVAEPVTEEGEVVLAGTIVNATKQSFSIEINGALYEGAAGDVIDIQALASPPPQEDVKKGEEKAGAKGAYKAADNRAAQAKARDAEAKQGPQFALVRVKKNAILVQRITVPASLLAAVGTWVEVVPGKAA